MRPLSLKPITPVLGYLLQSEHPWATWLFLQAQTQPVAGKAHAITYTSKHMHKFSCACPKA